MRRRPEVEFGARVRARRQELGLTQEKLAEHTGLSENYVSLIEQGAHSVTLGILLQVAHALGVQPGSLVDGLPVPSTK